MYNSLFHSRLTYCAASWGSNYKHTLNKIIILQNKVLKCIYKLPLRSNIDFIYKRHNILKVCDIVDITLLKNAYITYRHSWQKTFFLAPGLLVFWFFPSFYRYFASFLDFFVVFWFFQGLFMVFWFFG